MNAKTLGLLWVGSVCLVISAIAIFRLFIAGSIPITWDAAIIIDGSYRVLNGQIPHVDFSSPLGPITFIVGAIGMLISTPSVMGLNLGITLGGLGVVALGYFALKQSLSVNQMAAFLLILSSMALTPRTLGYPAGEYAYAGLYNTLGYSIILIVTMLMFTEGYRSAFNKGIWLSLFIILLLMLKISFSFAAIIIVLLGLVLERHQKPLILGLLTGGGVGSLASLLYFSFNMQPFFRDQIFVSEARLRSGAFSSVDFIIKFFETSFYDNLFVVIVTVCAFWVLPNWKRFALLGTATLLNSIILSSSISQPSEHILANFFALFVLLSMFQWPIQSNQASYAYIILIFSTFVWTGSLLMKNADGLWDSTKLRSILRTPNSFSIKDSRAQLTPLINEEMLKMYELHKGGITVGVNNIYPFYLGIEPLKGGLLYWQTGTTFDKSFIKKYQYFGDQLNSSVKLIFLGRRSGHADTVNDFAEAYSDTIFSSYKTVFAKDGDTILIRSDL